MVLCSGCFRTTAAPARKTEYEHQRSRILVSAAEKPRLQRTTEPPQTLKYKWILVFLIFAALSPIRAVYSVEGASATESLVSEATEAVLTDYSPASLPPGTRNRLIISKLIKCESGGRNISAPDSDGIVSDGVLQFHRSSKDAPAGSGTWAWMASLSGITGTPIRPSDAVRMADWAIDHGYLSHWSCAKILHLTK